MPRKFLKKITPHPARIKEKWFLRPFEAVLHDPALWHLNRRGASRALALGIFIAFVPLPFQMALAAVGAIIIRVNILVAVIGVWVSNPVTMGPMFYYSYRLGAWLLSTPPAEFRFAFTIEWVTEGLAHVWAPLLTGCAILGTLSALAGYFALNWIWQVSLVRRYRRRPWARRR